MKICRRVREARSAKAPVCGLLLLLLGCSSTGASAATMCVQANDILGLRDALIAASNNNEDDAIHLQSGHYSVPSNFYVYYDPGIKQHDLTIVGGYSDFFGDPCGRLQTAPDATQTVLEGGGQLWLFMPDGAGSISMKALTIKGMLGNPAHPVPVAISPYGNGNSTGRITISNSIFVGNASIDPVAAVRIDAGDGTLLVENSIFTSNTSLGGENPIKIFASNQSASVCVEIVNSTFVNNASSTDAIYVYVPCLVVAANDIVWGNPGGGLDVEFPMSTYMVNDDLQNLADADSTHSQNLRSVDPMMNSDLSLSDASPLRDAGADGGFFSPGQFDVFGNTRIYGAHPDIGAHEIQSPNPDVIFADDFD